MGFYDNKPKDLNKPVADTPVITKDQPHVIPDTEPVIKQPDELLTDRKYVINTVNNQTAVNTERLATVVEDLRGFAEGSAVKVTYYKQQRAETDTEGDLDRVDHTLNPVHKSLLKIHGFEIRLTGPLQHEHNAEETVSFLNGEAYTYPGFQPEKGDSFVMEVDTGKYGLMTVNAVPVRMAIRAATYYKISFTLTNWLSKADIELIENGIVEEAWFDKTRFLAEPGALLTHEEYVELKFLTKERSKMINYFKSKFLDDVIMYSYMRPDGMYDPYVTDFMLNIQDINELPYYAKQLFEKAPYLEESIWAAIRDYNIPYEAVPTSTESTVYHLGSKSVLSNSLINKEYLYWVDSASLAEWLEAHEKAESVYVKQTYPIDFKILTTTYALTTDTLFKRWKTYYTRSGTAGSYVYTKATFTPNTAIPANTYYEQSNTYGFKDGKTYYTRTDGLYSVVPATVTTPDPNTAYYLRTDTSTSTSTTGGLAPDPTIPDIPTGTAEQERTLGDLLLHIHHHYAECPYTSMNGGTGTIGTGLGLIMEGTNEHIDLLIGFLKDRSIDMKKLHVCIENVWKLNKLQQFYKMPLYIFLAQKALMYIHQNDGIFDRL